MAFPRRLLNDGEEVSLDLRPHWWFFANHIFTGVPLLVIFFLIIGETHRDLERGLKWIWAVVALVWAFWLLLQYLKWNFTHFVVTTDRVVFRTGVLAKHSVEIPLERVSNINFNQKLWERMIGAGDLEIESAGRDGQSRFDDVQHPEVVQQELYKQMELSARKRATWSQPTATPAPTANADASIPEQLEQLAGLRDRGVISAAEFEAKKAQLLERMQRGARMRIVSLVPSATETLLALGITPVACTRFCEQPALPTVGGTKDPDVAAIVALAPDLVVVNDEENRLADAEALTAAGLDVHSMSPRSVEDVGAVVATLAMRVDVPVPDPFAPDAWHAWLAAMLTPRWYEAFVAVWRRPWMSLAADTYGSSLLDLLGVGNVFAGALARYPEVTLDDVATAAPNIVILPSEPYPFAERHVAEIEEAVRGVPTVLVDGRDLFWWGIRTPAAAQRLRALLPGLDPR